MLLLKDEEFSFIVTLMKGTYGVDLSKKRPLIEGRLANHVTSMGFKTYMEYFKFAQEHKDELVNIVDKLTTNHTYFMRENDHFELFERTILPWIDNSLHTKDFRIWSAACSSGQEPYTLAMITQNYLGARTSEYDSTILASDISSKVLNIAKAGAYKKEELKDVPPAWIKKYFKEKDANTYQANDFIRSKIAYRYINLLEPFNFKKPFQCIFCRNVMIYFDTPTKNDLIAKFYDFLVPGGYLVIGHSESLSSCTHKFKYIMPSVYRKE